MYYKTLHIPYLNKLQQEVLSIVPPEALYTQGSLHSYFNDFKRLPSIAKVLIQNNLLKFLLDITLVCVPPKQELGVHTDGDRKGLNIPILNCQNTYIIWYQGLKEPFPVSQEGRSYFGLEKHDCIELCRVEMNEPQFVDLKSLHGSINPNNTFRLLLSIKLDHSFDFSTL